MNIYAISFKEKTHSKQVTAKQTLTFICSAVDAQEAMDQFNNQVLFRELYDVDKRTIKWAGSSFPMACGKYGFVHHGIIED